MSVPSIGDNLAPILSDPHSGVVLRAHRGEDIAAIVEQCRDPAMLEYTRIPRPYTVNHTHELLDLARTGWSHPSAVSPRFWAITTRGPEGEYAFAGTIDYRPTGHRSAVVGYGLHPAYRGAGPMSVALGLLLAYAFDHHGQDLMSWRAAAGNSASAKTAWLNGFQFEGHVRGLCLRPDGGFSDGWIATLHRDDPRAPAQPWSHATATITTSYHRADTLENAATGCVSERGIAPPAGVPQRSQLRLAWFGDSLMEHLDVHNPRLSDQASLPGIGEHVGITEYRNRGYVHALLTTWYARYPWIEFRSENHAHGGATSRDILATVRAATADPARSWDLVMLGAGINDVWRTHQQRHAEAVDIGEFAANLLAALQILTGRARTVVVIEQPPMDWEPRIEVVAANTDIVAYNQRARGAAIDHGAHYIEVGQEFGFAATCLGWSPTAPTRPAERAACMWSDGVHLSEYGDEALRALIDRNLSEHRPIDERLVTPSEAAPHLRPQSMHHGVLP